jgi:hypothetical protein
MSPVDAKKHLVKKLKDAAREYNLLAEQIAALGVQQAEKRDICKKIVEGLGVRTIRLEYDDRALRVTRYPIISREWDVEGAERFFAERKVAGAVKVTKSIDEDVVEKAVLAGDVEWSEVFPLIRNQRESFGLRVTKEKA